MIAVKKVVKERKHTCLHSWLMSKQYLLAIIVKIMGSSRHGAVVNESDWEP